MADWQGLIALRTALMGVFDRIADGEAPEPSHVATLNAEIAGAGASERLIPKLGGGWTLEDNSASGLSRLRHAIARDSAGLLTGDLARIKRCPAHDCLWLFHDASKNRSRRWCAMDECGARAKMRRLRSRPDS